MIVMVELNLLSVMRWPLFHLEHVIAERAELDVWVHITHCVNVSLQLRREAALQLTDAVVLVFPSQGILRISGRKGGGFAVQSKRLR